MRQLSMDFTSSVRYDHAASDFDRLESLSTGPAYLHQRLPLNYDPCNSGFGKSIGAPFIGEQIILARCDGFPIDDMVLKL